MSTPAQRARQQKRPEDFHDQEFTGDDLRDLVVAIELAIGTRSAGATPLGIAVINLCEDAIHKDRQK